MLTPAAESQRRDIGADKHDLRIEQKARLYWGGARPYVRKQMSAPLPTAHAGRKRGADRSE